MKQLKDRKFLITTLSLAIICIFTLTIAYSALSAVLTIQGNARVSATDWDIYLNNPRVTNGSATTNIPVIKTSSTLEFETTLNMPGDFYEFAVDVVNAGDIDAMIENVVKIPELTAEQAKFLKYEVSYQNGESITTKQLLAKDTTMPIKVRVEYRKDLSNTDLPTSQVVLDLALTLEYTQSDGTGSSVKDNGVYKTVSANGDINDIGTIVTIGSEQFYTIGTEGDNVKLLAMYNLYVGNTFYTGEVLGEDWYVVPLANPTGMQSDTARGYLDGELSYIGTTPFADDMNYNDYNGSLVEGYVNNYKDLLVSKFYVDILDARLINYDELTNFQCVYDDIEGVGNCNNSPSWVYSTSYWTIAKDSRYNLSVISNGNFSLISHDYVGVRPVIVISKDYFN